MVLVLGSEPRSTERRQDEPLVPILSSLASGVSREVPSSAKVHRDKPRTFGAARADLEFGAFLGGAAASILR